MAWLPYVWLVLGFVVLIKGADWLVEGASALAKRFNVPDILIGLTVVAFGTSAPELVVSISASLSGSNEIVFGNVLGSNVFNIGLILGVAGMIYPLTVQRSSLRYEIPFSLLLAGLLYLLCNDFWWGSSENIASRWDGVILLALFAGFLYYVYRSAGLTPDSEEEPIAQKPLWQTILFVLLGLGGLIWGGNLVVDNAKLIAKGFGMSERVIGLTVVGIGTSLPELVTSVTAALKRKSDIAVGNVVGSNIFNILLILGVSFTILPAPYPMAVNFDIVVLLGFSVVLWAFVYFGGRQPNPDGSKGKNYLLRRWQAAALFLAMLVYLSYILMS